MQLNVPHAYNELKTASVYSVHLQLKSKSYFIKTLS